MTSKIATVIFALVFAIGFGAGGAFGISSLVGQLNGWWQARTWQPISATVLDTALKESRGDTTTYQVTAHYRYIVDGRTYEGKRVGFVGGSDNVGTWQQDHYDLLSNSKRLGQPITVWVDPRQPEHSVVDRSIRWNMLVFILPFAILFPSISLGALWMLVRALRANGEKVEVNEAEIASNARAGVLTIWGFATFWGLIAFPIAILFVSGQPKFSWVWLVVLIFPAIGVVLIWVAVERTVRLLRNGEVSISLTPMQPRLGDSVIVRAVFKQAPPSGEYEVSLLCEKVDTRGEDTTHETKWKQERTIQNVGIDLACTFSPPVNLPSSQPPSGVYHRWRVLLIFPDGKDKRDFDIVITAASELVLAKNALDNSVATSGDAINDDPTPYFTGAGIVSRPIPESVATVVDEFSRLKIDYNLANSRSSAIGGTAFGIIFAGIGGFLMFSPITTGAVPTLMGLIFASVGIVMFGASVYAFTHRRSVEIAQGRLRVANRWLLNSKREEFSVSDVVKLVPSTSGIRTASKKHYDDYQIKAWLRDGREVVLASNIRDSGVVVTLMKLLNHRLSMTSESTVSVESVSSESSPESSKTRIDEASMMRMRNRVMLGAKIVGTLMLLAFLWDFFGMFIFDKPTRATKPANLEAQPRTHEPTQEK